MHPTDPEPRPLPDAPASRADRAARYFQTDDLQGNLAKRTARGGIYTIVSTGLNAGITLVCTILVTRQLTREDFGLFGMVTVLTGFAAMFVDLGLSKAVVQRPKINPAQISTLFWINLALSAGLAVIVASLTPALVWFYDEPRVAPLNLAMCLLFLVSASGLQHRALMQRRMEFGALNVIDVVAPVSGSLVSLVLAYAGAGYWALVALPITMQLVRAVAVWVVCPWRPGLPRRGSGVRGMLAFGGHVTGFQFINYFARNADNAMLGFAWGAGPLGLYTRAYSLMMMPATKFNYPLSSVVVPVLSRVTDQPDLYRNIYFRVLFCSALFLTLLVTWLALTIDQLVPLLLGPEWTDIVPVFYALFISCTMAVTNSANGWLYLSFGHVDRQLKWTFLVYVPILIIAMAIGVQWGVIGMAIGVSAAYLVLKPISFAYASRGTPVDLKTFLSITFKPIVFAGLAAVLAYWLSNLWSSPANAYGYILQMGIRTVIYVVLFIVASYVTGYSRNCIENMLLLKKTLRPS